MGTRWMPSYRFRDSEQEDARQAVAGTGGHTFLAFGCVYPDWASVSGRASARGAAERAYPEYFSQRNLRSVLRFRERVDRSVVLGLGRAGRGSDRNLPTDHVYGRLVAGKTLSALFRGTARTDEPARHRKHKENVIYQPMADPTRGYCARPERRPIQPKNAFGGAGFHCRHRLVRNIVARTLCRAALGRAVGNNCAEGSESYPRRRHCHRE